MMAFRGGPLLGSRQQVLDTVLAKHMAVLGHSNEQQELFGWIVCKWAGGCHGSKHSLQRLTMMLHLSSTLQSHAGSNGICRLPLNGHLANVQGDATGTGCYAATS